MKPAVCWNRECKPEVGFPLGKTGGLIEAPRRAFRRSAGTGSFRWVKPAASLKHDLSLRQVALFHQFPLGKTGGLIEAFVVQTYNEVSLASFRWVKPAASLKREKVPLHITVLSSGFRWVKPAASLKRNGFLGVDDLRRVPVSAG